MLGFYSCTKDEDDDTTTTTTTDDTTTTTITNFISIDGTKTELTKDIVVEEGRYFIEDATTGDSTFLRKWKIYIASDDLVIGATELSGAFTGLYAEVLSPEAEAPTAGIYVANIASAGILPSYTKVYYANNYDFTAQTGILENIVDDKDMVVTVSGENTTIKFEGSSETDKNALIYSYTAKLNISGAKKKGVTKF